MTSGSRRTRWTNFAKLNRFTAALCGPVLVPVVVPVLVVITCLIGAGPVAAQSLPDGDSNLIVDGRAPILEVGDQSTFVAADGALWLDLIVQPADLLTEERLADFQVAITVYGLLDSESGVDEPLSQPLNRSRPVPLDQLVTEQPGRFRLEMPIRSGSQFDDQERVLLPNPGVYPISVELRSADGPVATTRTHLIRLPQVTDEDASANAPLPVAIVLDVSTAEGLTLSDVRQLLIDHPSIPMTVVFQEGVENQLRNDPVLTSEFVAALAGRPVLAVPAVDLDPSALAEIDQADLYLAAIHQGRRDLEALGFNVADRLTLLDAPLTDAGLSTIVTLGMRSVLDTENQLATSGHLEAERKRLQVIRFDRDLSRILGGGTDGPHRANRVLAKMTLRASTDGAPVVIGGSALGVDPGASVGAFLRALTQPGAPQPILVSDVLVGGVLRTAERPEQDLTSVSDLLVAVQAKLTTYDGFHGGGGTDPDQYQQQILSALARQRNPEDRRGALELLSSQLDEDMSRIELHDGHPVTLAARSAPIPIIVENNSGGPREVLLRFRSDKVVAAEDRKLVTIEPGTSAIDIVFEARSLGVSPLEVSVWTPDGETLLANTRFEIRSTAVPGLGLLVSIGAVALLAGWWIVDARRRRAEPVVAAVAG